MTAEPPAKPAPKAPPVRSFAGLAQLGVVAVAVPYTIGLLIVNSNLGQYGIMNVDLARPEYIIAGALWLLLVGASLWGVHWSISYMQLSRNRLRHSVIFGLGAAIGWFAPAFFLLGSIGYSPGTDAPRWMSFASAALMGVTGATVYFICIAGVRLSKERAVLGHLPPIAVNFVPIVLVMELGLYAAVVYPDLPREVGGGRRPSVEVVLSDAAAIDWKAAGVPFSADTKTVGPVMLLLDTPGSLVVIRPEMWRERQFFRGATSARVVALDRKHVSAVIYLPRH